MSKVEYSPKRDIPKTIKELKSISPIEISKSLSNKYNQDISADSISKWFKRNKKKKEKLERDLSKESEIRKEIWDSLERGESKEEIMQNTKCSKTYYYKMRKEYENYTKILKEDESKDVHVIENIEEPSKIFETTNNVGERTKVIIKPRARARDRLITDKSKREAKPLPIKLMLNKFKNYKNAIRHALDNIYRWTKYNIQEIIDYLKYIEVKLNPVNIEVITSKHHYIRAEILAREYVEPYNQLGIRIPIDKAKELYNILDIKWRQPMGFIWIKHILKLKEISLTYRGLSNKYMTVKEWFEEVGLRFPPLNSDLEKDADIVITNRKDLERTGIFEDLEYELKKELRIDDELEYYYYTDDKLDSFDITRIKSLIREYPNHSKSVLLKEKLQDIENIS